MSSSQSFPLPPASASNMDASSIHIFSTDEEEEETSTLPNKKFKFKKLMDKNIVFDPNLARDELARMVIMHEYPLLIVDHIGFKSFVSTLQPCFKIPSRKILKSDIIKIYELERNETMRLLHANTSRISISANMWSAKNEKRRFMAITSHWIDESWTLQSRMLRFAYIPYSHTVESLVEVLMGCFLDWKIDKRLAALTVDDCIYNDQLFDILQDKLNCESLLLQGNFFHMRCFAHIVNLIVQEGFIVMEDAIERIRDSVAFWIATEKKKELFGEVCRQLDCSYSKRLQLDYRMRWDSTLLMLETALSYRNVFLHLEQHESSYKCLPTDEDWELVAKICVKLKLFYNVIALCSRTKHPTANNFFLDMGNIKSALTKWLGDSDETIKGMSSRMLENFEKYWHVIYGIMGVATILDPRYKMCLIECYFETLYGKECKDHCEKIRKVCDNLLKEYKERNEKVDHEPSVSSHAFVTSDLDPGNSFGETIVGKFLAERKRRITQRSKSDFDTYLEGAMIPYTNDFDILLWWKTEGARFPTLQTIARDVLAIPVSTIASESNSSTGGKFLSPHRNKMHPKTLEAIMCARDGIWKGLRQEVCPVGAYSKTTVLYEESDPDDVEKVN